MLEKMQGLLGFNAPKGLYAMTLVSLCRRPPCMKLFFVLTKADKD